MTVLTERGGGAAMYLFCGPMHLLTLKYMKEACLYFLSLVTERTVLREQLISVSS